MDRTRNWTGSWIEPPQQDVTLEPEFSLQDMFVTGARPPEPAPAEERLWPCPLMRRVVTARGPVRRATLHMTARGLYLASVNGRAVTDAVLVPEFTSYEKRLMYQTHDVTDLVHEGENVWGVVLADGWYAGRIAVQGDSCQFGRRLSVLGDLELEYEDGTTETVGTDEAFVCSTGKYVYADIQIGERQDLRLDRLGWDIDPGLADGWAPAVPATEPCEAVVVAQDRPPVVRRERVAAKASWREGDAVVVDFGQVVTGRVRIRCELADGQELRVEHSEALDADGRFFMNITGRNKDAVDAFVGRGGREELEPDFTFHGFRYVRITGWEGEFDDACIEAVVLRSDLATTGRVVTSDARVNRLLSNVEWSQRGNTLSVPTDCPQRERMGWTGDIQVYAPTGCFFMDLDAFLRSWLDQVMADQLEDGQIVDYSPMPRSERDSVGFTGAQSSAGWGDAIVLVPWELYRQYGDVEVLERCYDAMLAWHDYSVRSAAGDKSGDARYVWDTKFHYGDWMLPSVLAQPGGNPIDGAQATKDVVATCFLARQSDVLADVSEVLGRTAEAREQRAYAAAVRAAFPGAFYAGDGALTVEYQGAYVLALAFGMLPVGERQAAADHLARMVRDNGTRLDTGFLSVPYLLDVLGAWGHEDLAEDLFWQDECPSWLYEVDRGATTMWENWANVSPDGTVGAFSFNHYAFGCVGDWFVRHVGGLVLTSPGYETFDVRPTFIRGLDFVRLSHTVRAGEIEVAWTACPDGSHVVEVEVPEGTRAHVELPDGQAADCGAGSYRLTCAAR